MEKEYDSQTGKPIDKSYLECDLPEYLQHAIDKFVKGEKEKSSFIDCLWGELCGSINSAEVDGLISAEQAYYLRGKYLYDYGTED